MKKTVSYCILLTMISFLIISSTPSVSVASEQVKNKTVGLGGEAFGIRMFSDGVMVTEVEECLIGSDVTSPAIKSGIKANDIIKSVNGTTIYSNEQFTSIVAESDGPLMLTIERENSIIELTLTPISDSNGIKRIGLWIKDSAAGIGTVTYYDTENNSIGALGHGICESSTGKIIPLSYGEIAKAKISDITKSENGRVGSLNGYFDDDIIGKVEMNTDNGIFGNIICETYTERIEMASKDEVQIGDAQIYCTLNSDEKKCYNIKIKRLKNRLEDTMVIEVTDPKLLEITGGIVQGMSGSPIVQNGKLVGAVTHVLVNNVKCGYGIYIEDMMSENL